MVGVSVHSMISSLYIVFTGQVKAKGIMGKIHFCGYSSNARFEPGSLRPYHSLWCPTKWPPHLLTDIRLPYSPVVFVSLKGALENGRFENRLSM